MSLHARVACECVDSASIQFCERGLGWTQDERRDETRGKTQGETRGETRGKTRGKTRGTCRLPEPWAFRTPSTRCSKRPERAISTCERTSEPRRNASTHDASQKLHHAASSWCQGLGGAVVQCKQNRVEQSIRCDSRMLSCRRALARALAHAAAGVEGLSTAAYGARTKILTHSHTHTDKWSRESRA